MTKRFPLPLAARSQSLSAGVRPLSLLLLVLACTSGQAADVAIDDTQRLLFVGDREQNLIAVIDPLRGERIDTIETASGVDDLVVTPYAPLLIYANRDAKSLEIFNLTSREWIASVALPITPDHVVLDTTGSRIGITDSEDGGFVLVSAYSQRILFHLEDVPPTQDVLFSPDEIDVFYTGNGALGLIDTNTQRKYEMLLPDVGDAPLSSPSRSLDGRYIYVANYDTGEVYNINAYSKVIYKTFEMGAPARPFTTPQGLFLYLLDEVSGQFVAYDQHQFEPFADIQFDSGIDLVAVGRFDRMNLFLSADGPAYYLFDNVTKTTIKQGEFRGLPLDVQGNVEGTMAFVAFQDLAEVAAVNLESGAISYISATPAGAGAFALGLSNNVCH